MTTPNSDIIEILLVEDNPNDLALTQRALKKARLANHLHVCRDGAEALDFLFGEGVYAGRRLDQPPRVVLLDIKLPKVDGIEVLRRIKANPLTRTIPVVMLTSSKEQKDVVESYHLGVNSYIVKPVNFEGFASAVEQLGMYWLLVNQSPNRES
ncbi:response regulator [Rariglobus hedericola]|uniref:Response regulator n=1 Tax=Rariglobus hedericola TaxID=2597822 RepID=A0A556QNE8_9BACT|nr:response regulator [Rariglobus hedericola]TSJ78178.1 response regulator [Rariglobus hedericola]